MDAARKAGEIVWTNGTFELKSRIWSFAVLFLFWTTMVVSVSIYNAPLTQKQTIGIGIMAAVSLIMILIVIDSAAQLKNPLKIAKEGVVVPVIRMGFFRSFHGQTLIPWSAVRRCAIKYRIVPSRHLNEYLVIERTDGSVVRSEVHRKKTSDKGFLSKYTHDELIAAWKSVTAVPLEP